MDDQRIGRIVRALRRRLGWRQSDLAEKAECSQSTISFVERGHLVHVSLPTLKRILAAMGASATLVVQWRAGALDRLLDEDHAVLVGRVAAILHGAGWLVETEVTYSEFGERGSIDLLAFHPATGVLLVIEVKTDLASAEGTLRKLDEKSRLAAKIAQRRFGWPAWTVTRLVVFNEESTLRRRVARHQGLFGLALPMRGKEIRRWLPSPSAARGGIWFLSANDRSRAIQGRGGKERVRRPKCPPPTHDVAA